MANFLLIAASAMLATAAAAENAPALTLEQSASALDAAIAAGDGAALDRLLADDMLWVRGSGAIAGKREFLAGLADPALDIEPFAPTDVRWFKTATSGMITGSTVLRGTDSGEAFVDPHRFADYWELRDGRWRLVYVQVTRLPEAPKP